MPYRPYFAFHDKIRQANPNFKHCDAFYFNAFDPPRTLKPVDALNPATTTVDPKVTSQAPMPSPVQDPGTTKTPSIAGPGGPFLPVPRPHETAAGTDPGASEDPVASGDPGTLDGHTDQHLRSYNFGFSTLGSIESGSESTGSAGSGILGSSASIPGSQGSDYEDSNAGANPQSPGGEDASLTTIQLGQGPNAAPKTNHVGNSGDNQQSASAAASSVNPEHYGQQETSQANGGSKAQPLGVTVTSQVLTISDPSAVPIVPTVVTPGGDGVNVGGISVTSGGLIIETDALYASSSVFTIAGNIVTANPTSFDIAGMPVEVGQPAMTVSGVLVSLGSSGILVVGGSGVTADLPSSLVIIGSKSRTANPTALEVKGSNSSAGGPSASANPTPRSFVPQGPLVIGSTTNALSIPTPALKMTTDGVSAIFGQTGQIAVDGTTLSVGGPGVTVSGAAVSVATDGLVIGTDRISFPNGNGSTTGNAIMFKGDSGKIKPLLTTTWWSLLGILVLAIS